MDARRRSFLASVGAVVGLAGCSGVSERVSSGLPVRTPEPRMSPSTVGTEAGQPASAGTDANQPASAGTDTRPGPETPTPGPPVDETFGEATRQTASDVGTSVRESIVVLRGDRSLGTGWVVGDGEIVTNSHVVDGDSTLSVETFDGRTGTAERVGFHEDLIPDVALLETDVSAPTLGLGSLNDVSRGDPLITIGHPGSVGRWIISLGRHLSVRDGLDWVLSTVPTDQGNSGGPLVTLDGAVVGVVSGSTSPAGDGRVDFSRNETAFTELPEKPGRTTAVTIDALETSLSEWR